MSQKIREREPGMVVRPNWMHELAGVAQRGADRLSAQPHRFTRALLRHAPPPRTRLEEIIFLGLLFESALEGFGDRPAFASHAVRRALRKLLPRPSRQERDLLTKVERVAQHLIDTHARPVNVPALARREGLHQSTLRRAFLDRFGMAPREFQTRVRICRAIHLFAVETTDILAVARSVGYRSEKNFYRAVRRVTGLTPARLREARWPCRWDACSRLKARDGWGACLVQRPSARKAPPQVTGRADVP